MLERKWNIIAGKKKTTTIDQHNEEAYELKSKKRSLIRIRSLLDNFEISQSYWNIPGEIIWLEAGKFE